MKLIKSNKGLIILNICFAIFCISFILIYIKVSCNMNEIYILYGKNDKMELHSGYIYSTNNKTIINGGIMNLFENSDDIKSYTLSLYIKYKDKYENIFRKFSMNNSNSIVYYSFNNYKLGERTIELSKDLNYVADHCYLLFEYVKSDGTTHEISFKLDFVEIGQFESN